MPDDYLHFLTQIAPGFKSVYIIKDRKINSIRNNPNKVSTFHVISINISINVASRFREYRKNISQQNILNTPENKEGLK